MDSSLFHPYTYENVHPGFSIDCVVLCFANKKLKILLNKFTFGENWQLPGGFMFKTESAEAAAARILTERTETTDIYLKQFHLFSAVNRTDFGQNESYLDARKNEYTHINPEDTEKWYLNRFISMGFYALIKQEIKLVKDYEVTGKWFDINSLPVLYSDHKLIIETALDNIRAQLTLIPIAQSLLPDKFTMSEFRKIFEIILDKKLDRRNFQRKALTSNVVIQLDEVIDEDAYNSPILYTFNKEKDDLIEFHSLFK